MRRPKKTAKPLASALTVANPVECQPDLLQELPQAEMTAATGIPKVDVEAIAAALVAIKTQRATLDGEVATRATKKTLLAMVDKKLASRTPPCRQPP